MQIHYNGPFKGAEFWIVLCYILVARLAGARTVVRHGGRYHMHATEFSRVGLKLLRAGYLRQLYAAILQWPELRDKHVHFAARQGVQIRAVVVPNTVDAAYYSPGADRSHGHGPQDPIRVGFVAGPESSRKGVFVILEALRTLDREVLPAFSIAGIGAHHDVIRAAEAGTVTLGDVGWLGYIAGEKKRDWFRSLDIFLLPSLREGFPNVLLEAMSTECAVITTPVDAIPSVVEHERNGLLVAPGDPVQLAAALRRLLTDAEFRCSLGRNARQTVLHSFDSHGDWVGQIVDLYQQDGHDLR